jgi:hypothetical protein
VLGGRYRSFSVLKVVFVLHRFHLHRLCRKVPQLEPFMRKKDRRRLKLLSD